MKRYVFLTETILNIDQVCDENKKRTYTVNIDAMIVFRAAYCVTNFITKTRPESNRVS